MTGVTFNYGFNNSMAAIFLPILKSDDVLSFGLSEEIRNHERTLAGAIRNSYEEAIDITVDIDNHQFSGPGLKRLESHLILGSLLFGINRVVTLSVDELLAMILHEIGHFAHRVINIIETGNTCLLLKDLSDELIGENDVKKKRIIVGKNKALIDASDELANAKSEEEIYIIGLNQCSRDLHSKFGFNPLECRNFEYLADNYVTKWGLGKQLITGFDKLKRLGITGDMYNYALGFTTIGCVLGAVIAPVLGVIFAGIGLMVDLSMTGAYADNIMKDVYGSEAERIKSIRKGMINRLKDTKNRKQVKQALDDLESVESIIKNAKTDYPVAYKLGIALFPSVSGRSRYRRAALLAEDFAQAELNIHIEKLKEV